MFLIADLPDPEFKESEEGSNYTVTCTVTRRFLFHGCRYFSRATTKYKVGD